MTGQCTIGDQQGPDSADGDLTALEFFAGIGLMRLGLAQAGWRVCFANDIDETKARTYRANFAAEDLVVSDVRNVKPVDLPPALLATASFPCTDLSLAGQRQGLRGRESGALWPWLELLSALPESRRPPILMLENVLGLLSVNGGADFEAAVGRINSLAYRCDPFIVDAAHFVPQSRVRVFIVCVRDALGILPAVAVAQPSETRPKKLVDFMARTPHLRWGQLSIPSPRTRRRQLQELLEVLPEDAAEWWDIARTHKLLHQMSRKHRAVADELIRRDTVSAVTVYRRTRRDGCRAELRADGVAGCLRTARGGSSRQIVAFAGAGQFRARFMTPRECARLQGAPDSFVIPVASHDAVFAFGDAVCVPVIEWIARHYLNPLAAKVLERAGYARAS